MQKEMQAKKEERLLDGLFYVPKKKERERIAGGLNETGVFICPSCDCICQCDCI